MKTEPEVIRILHVDDEPDFAALAADFLLQADERFRVETATSADDGLEYVASNPIDCIVSDHDMPGKDGIEFLQTVRDDYPEIPFILFTGKGSEEIASEAISAGVTDYLEKQGGTDQYTLLANRILNAVEQARAQRDRDRHLQAMESAREGISYLDEDGRLTYVNQAYADLYGYRPADLIGEHYAVLYPEEALPEMRDEILPEVKETGYWHGETRGLRADGSTFTEDHVLSTTDGDEIVCAVRDVTDQRERRRALERYRNVVQAAGDAVYALNLDGRYTMVNDQMVEMTGYDREELIGSHASILLDESEIDEIEDLIKELLDGDRTVARQEGTRHTADGGELLAESRITLMTSETGEIQGTTGILRDITEQKEREAELERYETILEALGDPVYALDADGNYTYVNEAFIEETGYARSKILGESVSTVLSEPDAERGSEIISQLLTTDGKRRATWEMTRVTANGDEIPTENHLALLPPGDDGEFRGTAGVLRDISSRKQRERQLERQKSEVESMKSDLEEQYKQLFEEAPMMAIFLRDDPQAEGPVIIDTNSQFADSLGYAKEEIIGREVADFYTEDSKRKLVDEGGFERALAGKFTSERRDLVTNDGDVIDAILRAVPGQYAPGRETGTLAMYVDVSEQAEIKAANERLEAFASQVSHDLQNPLQVAEGRLELARDDCESEHLAEVDRALGRMGDLIDDFLALAQNHEIVSDRESLDLGDIAKQCWKEIEGDSASLVVDTDRNIEADRGYVCQLLENLFLNAVAHGGDGVTVTVGDFDEGFYVADDGPGIPEAVRGDVFEMGFSTDDEGTGFGLSIVRQIAQAHGWDVRVTDAANGGARFEFRGVGLSPD